MRPPITTQRIQATSLLRNLLHRLSTPLTRHPSRPTRTSQRLRLMVNNNHTIPMHLRRHLSTRLLTVNQRHLRHLPNRRVPRIPLQLRLVAYIPE